MELHQFETYEFDTTPIDEQCVQVGCENYTSWARIEASAYIGQIRRELGHEPAGSRLSVVFCPHDFGSYAQIQYRFDPENSEHLEYFVSLDVGSEICSLWDDEANAELRKTGYIVFTENNSEVMA